MEKVPINAWGLEGLTALGLGFLEAHGGSGLLQLASLSPPPPHPPSSVIEAAPPLECLLLRDAPTQGWL